ncbi:MAG: efflux transporter outer membrane subunit [Methylobacillus sp.]|jgi:NodT family efflux transporter outer membrane factor (OMF) lipoprotein|nr:efflux transporter outer membrane subunit [Methylobacillus sp.]
MPQINYSNFPVFAAILLGGLLSGCAGLSDIAPQSRVTPPETLDAGKDIADAPRVAWPTEQWWQVYGDPQLDALIARAVADSPTLRAAQARARLAEAYARGAHASTQPEVGADATSTRERFTGQQFIPPPWAENFSWNNEAALSFSYDLDLWGKKADLWNAALDDVHAAAAETQQVRLELQTSVARTYIRLAEAFALRDIAQSSLDQINERIAIAKRELEAGLGTQMEVSAAETALPVAQARVEALETEIQLQRNQLAALSGAGTGAGDDIARPALKLDASVGLPSELPAELIGRRPDVRASRWRVEAAGQRAEAAKKAFYPNINLLAFIGFQALGFGQFISDSAMIAGAGPAVSLPLFDAGRRRSEAEADTAAYDVAVENYNDTMIHALEQVSDQLVLLQSGATQREKARQSLASAEEAYRMAQQAHHAGLKSYRDVLDAQAVVFRQREFLAHAQAQWLDAHAGLMRALGGGANAPESGAGENPQP